MPLVVGNVCIQLPQMLMTKGICFQLNEDMTFEYSMVEDHIHKEVLISNEDALLFRFKTESVPHFQQEVLQSFEECAFEISLSHCFSWPKTKKLKHIRITYDLLSIQLLG